MDMFIKNYWDESDTSYNGGEQMGAVSQMHELAPERDVVAELRASVVEITKQPLLPVKRPIGFIY